MFMTFALLVHYLPESSEMKALRVGSCILLYVMKIWCENGHRIADTGTSDTRLQVQ